MKFTTRLEGSLIGKQKVFKVFKDKYFREDLSMLWGREMENQCFYLNWWLDIEVEICNLIKIRGTGMIASSSTFRPHPGRVIRDLFRLLDAVYGIVRKH